MDDDEFLGQGPQRFGAARGAVDGTAQASRGARLPRQDHLSFAVEIEDRGRAHVRGDRVRDVSDRRRPRQRSSAPSKQGLARAGLAGEHVEAGTELQSGVLDDAETVGVQLNEL